MLTQHVDSIRIERNHRRSNTSIRSTVSRLLPLRKAARYDAIDVKNVVFHEMVTNSNNDGDGQLLITCWKLSVICDSNSR